MINNEPRELTFIFNSEKMEDRKARAHTEALGQYTIKTLNVLTDKLTATQIAELADKMGVEIVELVDETYEPSPEERNVEVKSMESSEIVKVLTQNPELLKTPILVIGDKAYHYSSAYDIVKKDLGKPGTKSVKSNVEDERL